jgi:hypothetical protein
LKTTIFKKPSSGSLLASAGNICMTRKEIDWRKPVYDLLAFCSWRLFIAAPDLLNLTLTVVHSTVHSDVFSPEIYMGTLPSTPSTTGTMFPAASTMASYTSWKRSILMSVSQPTLLVP